MKKYAYFRYFLVFLVMVLPYVGGVAFQGVEMVFVQRKPEAEEYLPMIVSSQITADMEQETIKAQTVIARSNTQRKLREGKMLPEILR